MALTEEQIEIVEGWMKEIPKPGNTYLWSIDESFKTTTIRKKVVNDFGNWFSIIGFCENMPDHWCLILTQSEPSSNADDYTQLHTMNVTENRVTESVPIIKWQGNPLYDSDDADNLAKKYIIVTNSASVEEVDSIPGVDSAD